MTNSTFMKRWLPIALCCLPGISVAIAVSVWKFIVENGSIHGVDPKAFLFLLTELACPVVVGIVIWLTSTNKGNHSLLEGDAVIDTTDRLAAFSLQRVEPNDYVSLVQIAELQAQHQEETVDQLPMSDDDTNS